jgi:hypothetical protein
MHRKLLTFYRDRLKGSFLSLRDPDKQVVRATLLRGIIF